MANLTYAQGSAVSFKASGGDVTFTLTSLANGSGRQSAKADLGATRARLYDVLFASSLASAGTNGNEVELYWGASTSGTAGTDNPGSLSGSDAALTTPDEYKLHLMYVGSLIVSNAAGTGIQKQKFVFSPPTRYGMFVVVNKSGQALGSTAGDHEVRITPLTEAVA